MFFVGNWTTLATVFASCGCIRPDRSEGQMNAPPEPDTRQRMRATLLKIAAVAGGITLALCIAAAGAMWYGLRPKPPKQWDTKAIVPTEPTAGFAPTNDKDYQLIFTYKLKNTTSTDYSVDDSKSFKIVVLWENNVLSQPLPSESLNLSTPIFIPSRQTSEVDLRIKLTLPSKTPSESDAAYHERLRAFLNETAGSVKGIVLFDEVNHYRIDLPPWSRTKPANTQQSASPSSNNKLSAWRPNWETVPDKSKKAKEQLSPTLVFADDWLGFIPTLDTDEQKKQHQKDIERKELVIQAVRRLPECKGVTFMRSNPKTADFDVQVFNGLDGRIGKWQWVLYRTDIIERLSYGEETDTDGVAKSVCTAVHASVGSSGGKVE